MYHPYLLLYVVLACLALGEGISKNIPDAQQLNDIADTYFRNNIIPATISVCSFLISMIYYRIDAITSSSSFSLTVNHERHTGLNGNENTTFFIFVSVHFSQEEQHLPSKNMFHLTCATNYQ